jgi:hypothetical protein
LLIPQIIDFRNSFITWYFEEKDSFGRFNIDAVCKASSNGTTKTYFLLSSVIAGNVYGINKLIKIPPYKFTAIFSENEYKIFRRGAYQNEFNDSAGPLSDITTKLIFQLKPLKHREVCEINKLRKLMLLGNSFVVVMNPLLKNLNTKFEFQFPVKHINLRNQKNAFQIETGPILFPGIDNQSNFKIDLFELAFTNFNRFDEAYFAVQSDNSFFSGKANKIFRFYTDIRRVKTKINLFSN